MVFPFLELVHFVYRAFLKTTEQNRCDECNLYNFFVICIGEQVRHYHSPHQMSNVKCLFIVVMHLATQASSQACQGSRFKVHLNCHLNWRKQIFQMNITGLKIPTGGRHTSWLFTSMTEELNWGPPRNNSRLVVRVGLEPATSGFQVRRPNHSATLPPLDECNLYNFFVICIGEQVRHYHSHNP